MASSTDKLVADYLKRLNAELRNLPKERRRELVEEISSHIAEARASLETENEVSIRSLLERLGEPAEIAAEARGRFGVERHGSALDIVALILLLVGGVVLPVIGWVIGVVLLWISETWTTTEKVIGTLVVPGGLALPLFLTLFTGYRESCSGAPGGPLTCTGGPSQAAQVLGAILVIALFVAPLATTAFLAHRRTQAVATA
jgi:HAAS